MSGSPAYGLDQRSLGAQETLLVRIQNGHQRNFGNIQAFPQKIDSDQDIEFTEAQVTDDFDPLNGFYVGMQIANLDTVFGQVIGQIFRHAFGQCRYQYPLTASNPLGDLRQQIV